LHALPNGTPLNVAKAKLQQMRAAGLLIGDYGVFRLPRRRNPSS